MWEAKPSAVVDRFYRSLNWRYDTEMTSEQATEFRFLCYLNLKKGLGRIGAIAACTELLVREFITNKTDSTELIEFVTKLGNDHNVKISHVDPMHMSSRVSQLHIVGVFQQFEEFLLNFKDEHPQSAAWSYEEHDDWLTRILKNIGPRYRETLTRLGETEISICDYYRLVRNRFMHSRIDTRKVDKLAVEVKQQVRDRPEYKSFDAPNLYYKITFGDFLLYAMTSRLLAKRICSFAKPTNQEIADMLMLPSVQEYLGVNIMSIRGIKAIRQKTKLASLLRIAYNLSASESEPVIALLLSGPLA